MVNSVLVFCPNGKVFFSAINYQCIILVHNFRTEVIGHTQISAVFAPEYERVINIHGYNRIPRYYLEPGNYETDKEVEMLEENFGNDGLNEDGF